MFGIVILVEFVGHDYNYIWHKNEFCSISKIVVYINSFAVFFKLIVVLHDIDAKFYLVLVALVLF